MGELGYYAQIQSGIFGQPDLGGADPVRQAALQESVRVQNQAIKEGLVLNSQYVAQGTGNGPSAPEWASQSGGPANLPQVGWTAQAQTRQPFVVQPDKWTAAGMGTVPDWTSDPNPAAAGSYDMTSPPAYDDYRRSDELQGATQGAGGGAIGTPFWDAPGAQEPDNPNTSSQFSQGAIGQSLEW